MIINYLKRHRYLLTFLSVILLISILFGIIIFYKCNKLNMFDNYNNLKDNILNNSINNIFNHLFNISIIIILSLTILGYFSSILYLFYEGISISLTICILALKYSFKGLIFGIIYNTLYKLPFICLYLLILVKISIIISTFIKNYFTKNKFYNNEYIKNNILAIFILLIIIVIYDLILFIFSNFMLKYLTYML